MPTTTSNVTIVRNISGGRRFFSFFGKNGAWVDADDDLSIPGSLAEMWRHNTIQTAALKAGLGVSYIILKTPDVFVYDETDEQVYVLGADNGAAVAVDPDTGSYAGDPPDV